MNDRERQSGRAQDRAEGGRSPKRTGGRGKPKDAHGRKKPRRDAGASSDAKSAAAAVAESDTEDWEANRKRVEALCMDGPNYLCADCGEAGTRWASVNHGLFVCIRCSGVHRALGVHVSKVKSANMDRWSAAEVDLMSAIGNKRGKALYEAHLGAARPPTIKNSDEELRAFIERKYVQREFAMENAASVLRKAYKQVGYGKYKRAAGGATAAAGGAAVEGEELRQAAPRADAKAVREGAMRAFYGEAAATRMGRRSPPPAAARASAGATAAGERPEGPARPAGRVKERRGKALHGTFGVVNVDADVYEARLRAVLAAFGIAEAAPEADPEEAVEAAPPARVEEAAVGAPGGPSGEEAASSAAASQRSAQDADDQSGSKGRRSVSARQRSASPAAAPSPRHSAQAALLGEMQQVERVLAGRSRHTVATNGAATAAGTRGWPFWAVVVTLEVLAFLWLRWSFEVYVSMKAKYSS